MKGRLQRWRPRRLKKLATAKADAEKLAAESASQARKNKRRKKKDAAAREKENQKKESEDRIAEALSADREARLKESLARKARRVQDRTRNQGHQQRAAILYVPLTPKGLAAAMEKAYIPHSITHVMENQNIDGETFMDLNDKVLENYCNCGVGEENASQIYLKKLLRMRGTLRNSRGPLD